jgi:hypothetical protein
MVSNSTPATLADHDPQRSYDLESTAGKAELVNGGRWANEREHHDCGFAYAENPRGEAVGLYRRRHLGGEVDLLSDDVVRVYRAASPDTPTIDRRGEIADAEPAVPGWRMPVDELFE